MQASTPAFRALAARTGSVLGLEAEGEDSEQALGELASLVRGRFGEEA